MAAAEARKTGGGAPGAGRQGKKGGGFLKRAGIALLSFVGMAKGLSPEHVEQQLQQTPYLDGKHDLDFGHKSPVAEFEDMLRQYVESPIGEPWRPKEKNNSCSSRCAASAAEPKFPR